MLDIIGLHEKKCIYTVEHGMVLAMKIFAKLHGARTPLVGQGVFREAAARFAYLSAFRADP